MEDVKNPSVLIISEDVEFYNFLLNWGTPKGYNFEISSTLATALINIKNAQLNFNGVFLDPSIENWEGLKSLSDIHQHRPGVSIYFVADGNEEKIREISLEEAGVERLVQNKDEAIEVIESIASRLQKFDFSKEADSSETKNKAKSNVDQAGGNLAAIRAASFLSGSVSSFDVFVRLREGKYLKLLTAGDKFEPERLNKYLEKGLEYFYIEKSAQSSYVEYCSKLTSKILNSKNISSEVKLAQTFNQGDETLHLLKSQGLDDESLEFAINYAKNVSVIVKKVALDNTFINSMMTDLVSFEHSTCCTYIAGLLSRKLDFSTKEGIEIIGLAATLHDIGLLNNNSFDAEDVKYLDEIEVEKELGSSTIAESRKRELASLYFKHPIIGSEIVSKLEGVDPLVSTVIAQHHEKINGKGFPRKIKEAEIHQMSQVVAVRVRETVRLNRKKTTPICSIGSGNATQTG